MANICLDSEKLLDEAAFASRFGGIPQKRFDSRSYCYRFEGPGKLSFARFEFKDIGYGYQLIDVKLSKFALCSKFDTAKSESDLDVDGRIKLGDRDEQILRLYGQPTYTILPPSTANLATYFDTKTPPEVDKVLQYNSETVELFTVLFYFISNQLVGVDFSRDE